MSAPKDFSFNMAGDPQSYGPQYCTNFNLPLFTAVNELLLLFEGGGFVGTGKVAVHIGRLYGLSQALDIISGWPDQETCKAYKERIGSQLVHSCIKNPAILS
jgi:hypothetical protein